MSVLRNLLSLLIVGHTAAGAVIFQDGFEAGSLGPAWSISATSDGRAVVTGDHVPAAGQFHLLLDDFTNDARSSVAEATLTVSVPHKRNIVLTFKARSTGNEPHEPPVGNFTEGREYDGVAVSIDGGLTWHAAQSLALTSTTWQSYSVGLDAAISLLNKSAPTELRIRFSQYDNAPAPLDGIAIDEVVLSAEEDQRAFLELPSPVLEGAGPLAGRVVLAFAPDQPLTLMLSASPGGQLALPATVTVPAGQTIGEFEFAVSDNGIVDLARSVAVYAIAEGVTANRANVMIYDDEAPSVSLSLPTELAEGVGAAGNASVSIDQAGSAPLTISFQHDPPNELTLPSFVTIPAGQRQVAFAVTATDDKRIDGNLLVTVRTIAPGMAEVAAQTTTVDNESRNLSFPPQPVVLEGGSALGTVQISGTLPNDLTVQLTSASPASLDVPSSVTIAAGTSSQTFPVTAADNIATDGSRNILVSASAETFTDASAAMTIRDNEVASYRLQGLTDIVNVSAPVPLTVFAADMEGNIITDFSGPVTLELISSEGSLHPIEPELVHLGVGSGWSGQMKIPSDTRGSFRLRASDSSNRSGLSGVLDTMRMLKLTTGDLAWDAARSRIYASVPLTAPGLYANQVIAIDPETLQVSATTGPLTQDPRQLTLTSGSEALYVALDGNGRVAKIDPSAMSVTSSFAVGVSNPFGTLYAEDICAVPGQPDLVVMSQYRKGTTATHHGLAVYDHGVARPTGAGSARIEPSHNPNLFFGYSVSGDAGFRQIKLDPNGVTQVGLTAVANGGDMRSAGNYVFFTNGVLLDGTTMLTLGKFGVSGPGPVCPDVATNRVSYLEPTVSTSNVLDAIGNYDSLTFARLARLTLPGGITSPASFIRWGDDGFAFRAGSAVFFLESSRLVPTEAPADLAVTVHVSSEAAAVREPLVYTIELTNRGPNLARDAVLIATLSEGQTIQTVTTTSGSVNRAGSTLTLRAGDLAPNSSTQLTVVTVPDSAGALSCQAVAHSSAADADYSNNSATKRFGAIFQSKSETAEVVRLAANNLIYDATRNLLWATISNTVSEPYRCSLVAVDPRSGAISPPFPIGGNPVANSIALSANGRYLYVAISDAPEVVRVDLNASPYARQNISLRSIPGYDGYGGGTDIEVLDGEGSSFVVAAHLAAVFDGTTPRPNTTYQWSVNRLERTGQPGVFIGYDTSQVANKITRLVVSPNGVAINTYQGSMVEGSSVDIQSSGALTLLSSGHLLNNSNLSLRLFLGMAGRACVDSENGLAYIVRGAKLWAFDTTTGSPSGSFNLPTAALEDWAQKCVRWGLDGFAILGKDGQLYIGRSSLVIPANRDQDHDSIADVWEATYFGTLSASSSADADGDGLPNALEYLFGTSPLEGTVSPVQFGLTSSSGQVVLHLTYPRRSGLANGAFAYEVSSDLQTWNAAPNVIESIVSTQSVNGVELQVIDASITMPSPSAGVARLKWLGP